MIYFIQDSRTLEIKIGYTGSACVNDRLNSLQTGNASRLEVIACVPGDQAEETKLHRMFAASRVGGEWFRLTADLLRHLAFVVIGAGMYEEGRASGYKSGYTKGLNDGGEDWDDYQRVDGMIIGPDGVYERFSAVVESPNEDVPPWEVRE